MPAILTRPLRLLLPVLALALSPAMAADYLELTGFELIDGTGAPARPVQRLVIGDGVIVAIDALGEIPEPAAGDRWTRIDLDGAWVMPGLIDTHVHVARFPNAFAQAERILDEAVRGGVTAVRDLGGDARALGELERRANGEDAVLPTVAFGAMFGGPDIYQGGPTSQLARGRTPGRTPWTQTITADTDLALAVAEARGAGSRHIKLYGHMSPPLARAVIAEADRQGVLTVAHATVFSASPGDLVDAGIGMLSHAPYLVWEALEEVPSDYGLRISGAWRDTPADHPRLLALYRSMAERGVYLDATLFVYKRMREFSPMVQADWTAEAFAWAVEATRHAHRAGVPITAGTDWFEPRDGGLPHTHEELQLLVEDAGLTPMEAIVAGTRNGARSMGLGDSHGTVEVGKVADLLVLDADPLADIANTRQLRFVVRRGVVVELPSWVPPWTSRPPPGRPEAQPAATADE